MHQIDRDLGQSPMFPVNHSQPLGERTSAKSSADQNGKARFNLKSSGNSNQVSTLLINASRLIDCHEKNLSKALIAETLKISPHHVAALKLLARAMDPLFEAEQLEKIHQEIVKHDASFQNMKNLADTYYAAEKFELALECYFEASSLVGETVSMLFDVYKSIGNILVKQGDFDGGEEFYHKALCLQSSSDVLMVNLGTLAIQRQDYETANDQFRDAIRLNDKNEKAWIGLAIAHFQKGDLELSLANIQKALDLKPNNKTALILESQWIKLETLTEKTLIRLQNYLNEHIFDPEISLILIQHLIRLEKWEAVNFEIERHLIWEPHSEDGLRIERAMTEQGLR